MTATTLLLAVTLAALPQTAPPPTAASLEDVAFIAGHWLGGEGSGRSEEVWTEPAGDSMLGMWRYVADGQVRVVELLALRQEGDGVVLRLRHFDPQLVAREDKETPVVLRLVRRAPNEARFEGPAVGEAGLVVLTYRRPAPDRLEVTLDRDGKVTPFTFRRR